MFTLPYPSKHATDPLPLGALVSPGTSNEEPGLLVIMPLSGKISFWEHISSAATLDFLRQQRNGVEDTIPSMFGGEHVVQVTKVDSAGFILSFSSGRLAHLSVRDGQGKPAISIQFLRASWGQSAGIWDNVFGGIKNALKSAVQRGDLAAVRVDPANRVGGKNVIAASKNGRLHTWRVQRGGHHEVIANVDAREPILKGLQQVLLPVSSSTDLELVDFTYVPRGIESKYVQASRLSEALTKDDESIQHLLLLVSLSSKRQSQYALVELEIEGESVAVGMIRALSSYNTPINPSATERPRIYLPRPGLVAYIVFDRAVVVASVAALPETPDSQLQEENNMIPATFEDVIDLRNDDALEIVGTGLEESQGPGQDPETSRSHRSKVKNPTALLMIRGVGVVKIALSDVDRFGSDKPPEVTAKNKLEQAVFYGLKDDNPLVFEGRRQIPFSDAEIGQAALEVSDDILASRSLPLVSGSAATEINLRQRSTYLDKLMSHLNTQKVTLDRRTKWQLLTNAEKMSMAREVWKLHETFLNERPKSDKKTIVSEAIECINEEDKKNPDRAAGELDRARTWFFYDAGRLDILLPWTYQMLKSFRKHKLADEQSMTRLIHEGTLVFYETLRGALEYRKRNLDFYGLGDETIEFGILAKEEAYEGLPKFWTSTEFTCEYFYRLIELCQMWLVAHYPPEGGAGSPDPVLIQSIRDIVPNLIDQLILTLQEFIRWSKGNQDDSVDADGTQFSRKCEDVLDNSTALILKLKDFGLWDEALAIAEKYTDNRALAELIVAQITDLAKQTRPVDTRAAGSVKAKLDNKKRLFAEYMNRYGASFAFEAYKLLLEHGGPDMVLDFSTSDTHGFATMFLRTNPRLGKISWINDIERENDLDQAAHTLVSLGQEEEHVWSKKIELSLGKLTLLAEGAGAEEKPSAEDRSKAATIDAELVRVEKELEIVQVQNRVHQMLYPVFQNTIDDEAAVEIAMKEFAPKVPKKYKVLDDDLRDAISQLVAHKAMRPLALINLLTLIRIEATGNVETDLFWLAIRVADIGLQGEQREQAFRLIWRRCYLRDDWAKVNHTENMNDHAVLEVLTQTQAYCTMIGCVTYRKFLNPTSAALLFRANSTSQTWPATIRNLNA